MPSASRGLVALPAKALKTAIARLLEVGARAVGMGNLRSGDLGGQERPDSSRGGRGQKKSVFSRILRFFHRSLRKVVFG